MKNLYYRLPNLVLMLWIGLFFILPFLIIVFISLSVPSESIPPFEPFLHYKKDVGVIVRPVLDNFLLLFHDKVYLNSYFLSLKLAFKTSIICLLIGYPMAFYIATRGEKKKKFLLLLLLIPFFTSLLLRVYSWMILLKGSGIINNSLMFLNIISEPLRLLNNESAVLIGMVYCYLPFMVLPLYSAIEKLNPRIIEAAQDLGAKNFTVFVKIIIPVTVNGIISGLILVFIPAVGEFVIPDLLGGSEVMTIGKLIWSEFYMIRNWPVTASMAISLCILLILPIIGINKLNKNS